MIVEKLQEMLLEDEKKLKANSEALALVTRTHGYQGKRTGSYQHCGKIEYKENACWKKYLKFIPS